ncbi:MAG: WHG domain-containing protein, partial [Actinomycetota bacterium]|nr:WHG domain-containing protein [Actinomycetota bacterium]
SIYLHFADKNEMLFAVCERHFDELDRVTQAAGERAEDPLESLFLRGRAYIRFGLDRPEHYRVLFMGKAAALPAGFEEMRLRRMAAFDHLVEAVERCMDSGAIARRDPYLAALGLWAAGHGLTSLLISKPTFTWPDLDVLIDHVLSVQIYGLASPPSR